MGLNIKIDKKILPFFLMLLQEGVGIKSRVGVSIKDMLKNHLGITDEYIDKRISTVFLDDHVVDDLDKAKIKEGSILALSGAMPGLVGATLRTHSFYASFRDAITYKENADALTEKKGLFKIKLFNVLLNDLGPVFLEKGIILEGKRMAEVIKRHPEIQNHIKGISLDDKTVDLYELYKKLSSEDTSQAQCTIILNIEH